jgi:hypothetical protein
VKLPEIDEKEWNELNKIAEDFHKSLIKDILDSPLSDIDYAKQQHQIAIHMSQDRLKRFMDLKAPEMLITKEKKILNKKLKMEYSKKFLNFIKKIRKDYKGFTGEIQ